MKNFKKIAALILVVLMLSTSAVAFADYPEKAMDTLLYGTGDTLYTFTRYFEKRA